MIIPRTDTNRLLTELLIAEPVQKAEKRYRVPMNLERLADQSERRMRRERRTEDGAPYFNLASDVADAFTKYNTLFSVPGSHNLQSRVLNFFENPEAQASPENLPNFDYYTANKAFVMGNSNVPLNLGQHLSNVAANLIWDGLEIDPDSQQVLYDKTVDLKDATRRFNIQRSAFLSQAEPKLVKHILDSVNNNSASLIATTSPHIDLEDYIKIARAFRSGEIKLWNYVNKVEGLDEDVIPGLVFSVQGKHQFDNIGGITGMRSGKLANPNQFELENMRKFLELINLKTGADRDQIVQKIWDTNSETARLKAVQDVLKRRVEKNVEDYGKFLNKLNQKTNLSSDDVAERTDRMRENVALSLLLGNLGLKVKYQQRLYDDVLSYSDHLQLVDAARTNPRWTDLANASTRTLERFKHNANDILTNGFITEPYMKNYVRGEVKKAKGLARNLPPYRKHWHSIIGTLNDAYKYNKAMNDDLDLHLNPDNPDTLPDTGFRATMAKVARFNVLRDYMLDSKFGEMVPALLQGGKELMPAETVQEPNVRPDYEPTEAEEIEDPDYQPAHDVMDSKVRSLLYTLGMELKKQGHDNWGQLMLVASSGERNVGYGGVRDVLDNLYDRRPDPQVNNRKYVQDLYGLDEVGLELLETYMIKQNMVRMNKGKKQVFWGDLLPAGFDKDHHRKLANAINDAMLDTAEKSRSRHDPKKFIVSGTGNPIPLSRVPKIKAHTRRLRAWERTWNQLVSKDLAKEMTGKASTAYYKTLSNERGYLAGYLGIRNKPEEDYVLTNYPDIRALWRERSVDSINRHLRELSKSTGRDGLGRDIPHVLQQVRDGLVDFRYKIKNEAKGLGPDPTVDELSKTMDYLSKPPHESWFDPYNLLRTFELTANIKYRDAYLGGRLSASTLEDNMIALKNIYDFAMHAYNTISNKSPIAGQYAKRSAQEDYDASDPNARSLNILEFLLHTMESNLRGMRTIVREAGRRSDKYGELLANNNQGVQQSWAQRNQLVDNILEMVKAADPTVDLNTVFEQLTTGQVSKPLQFGRSRPKLEAVDEETQEQLNRMVELVADPSEVAGALPGPAGATSLDPNLGDFTAGEGRKLSHGSTPNLESVFRGFGFGGTLTLPQLMGMIGYDSEQLNSIFERVVALNQVEGPGTKEEDLTQKRALAEASVINEFMADPDRAKQFRESMDTLEAFGRESSFFSSAVLYLGSLMHGNKFDKEVFAELKEQYPEGSKERAVMHRFAEYVVGALGFNVEDDIYKALNQEAVRYNKKHKFTLEDEGFLTLPIDYLTGLQDEQKRKQVLYGNPRSQRDFEQDLDNYRADRNLTLGSGMLSSKWGVGVLHGGVMRRFNELNTQGWLEEFADEYEPFFDLMRGTSIVEGRKAYGDLTKKDMYAGQFVDYFDTGATVPQDTASGRLQALQRRLPKVGFGGDKTAGGMFDRPEVPPEEPEPMDEDMLEARRRAEAADPRRYVAKPINDFAHRNIDPEDFDRVRKLLRQNFFGGGKYEPDLFARSQKTARLAGDSAASAIFKTLDELDKADERTQKIAVRMYKAALQNIDKEDRGVGISTSKIRERYKASNQQFIDKFKQFLGGAKKPAEQEQGEQEQGVQKWKAPTKDMVEAQKDAAVKPKEKKTMQTLNRLKGDDPHAEELQEDGHQPATGRAALPKVKKPGALNVDLTPGAKKQPPAGPEINLAEAPALGGMQTRPKFGRLATNQKKKFEIPLNRGRILDPLQKGSPSSYEDDQINVGQGKTNAISENLGRRSWQFDAKKDGSEEPQFVDWF